MSALQFREPKGFSLLGSTNGTFNVIIFVLFALAAAFGIGEEPVAAFIAALTPIIGFIREIIEGKRKARWVGNILTYLFSAILLLAPWLDGLLTVLKPIGDAIASGNYSAIFGLLIPVVNEVLLLLRTRPWEKEDKS